MEAQTQLAVKPAEVPGMLGVFEMTNEEYHAHPALSNSGMGHLLRSPAHYIAYRNHEFESTPAQELGQAIHYGILEPQLFFKRYFRLPEDIDRRTKAGKEAYETLCRQNPLGKPLKARDFETVERMIEAAYSHSTVSNYLRGGVTERSFFWIDEETGVHCKSRPDYLRNDGIIVDLKTTESAFTSDFQRSVANYGYHRQAAFGMDGLKKVLGRDQTAFVLLAIEKEPPYGIGVFMLDDEAIGVGQAEYKGALQLFAHCQKTNEWPCYPPETRALSLPRWKL